MIELIMIRDGDFSTNVPEQLDIKRGWRKDLFGDFYGDGYIRFQELLDDSLWLIQIYTNEGSRLKGVGSRLIGRLEEIAKDRGRKYIHIETGTTENDDFGKFLVKKGYTRNNEQVGGRVYHWHKTI